MARILDESVGELDGQSKLARRERGGAGRVGGMASLLVPDRVDEVVPGATSGEALLVGAVVVLVRAKVGV